MGLVLLCLTLYISTLAYAVDTYSRARLTELLPNVSRERWLAWLDEHDHELQALASLLRLVLNFGVLTVVLAWETEYGRVATASRLVSGSVLAIVLLATFAIAVPHALARHAGEPVLARSLRVLAVLRWVLWPVGRVFDATSFVVRRLLGIGEETPEAETERAEQEILDAVSEGEAQGAVDEDQVEMIESVFALDETQVSAIMTPRTEIDAVPASATFDEVRTMIVRCGHSRVPVYEESVDHIVGVVYAKDLLKLRPADPFDARKVMRIAPYVPETKTLDELLEEFRQARVQIAIVLDEYGGTAGLVTLEDILEELVGEIDDEYDQPPPPAMRRIDAQTLEVDARVRISEINAELELTLPEEEDYETIGGYVFATLGKIPAAGEEFERDGLRVRVVDAEPRRIKRLQLTVLAQAQTA